MRFLAIGLVMLIPALLIAQERDGNAGLVKRPLDLPVMTSRDNEEDEDYPESITFYGSEVEGDAFFWCFPIYGFCGETDIFESIKEEITGAMMQLSSRSMMGLVGYNSMTYVWSYEPRRANGANKASAVAWMEMLVPIESHCLLDAALTTISISQQADGHQKQLIVMGSRTPYCGTEGGAPYAETCLTSITGANYENAPINTVYFTSSFYSGEQQFYLDLAAMNSGSFKQVDY